MQVLMARQAQRHNQAGETWQRSVSLPSAVTPSGTRPVRIGTVDHITSFLVFIIFYLPRLWAGVALVP